MSKVYICIDDQITLSGNITKIHVESGYAEISYITERGRVREETTYTVPIDKVKISINMDD